MRSQREEYAARFEELTNQEIKNYNNSLLETHTALEDFRSKLRDSVTQYAKQVAQLSSEFKEVKAENIDLRKEIKILSRKIDSQTNNFNQSEKTKMLDYQKASSEIKLLKNDLDLEKSNIGNIDTYHGESIRFLKRYIDDLHHKIKQYYKESLKDNSILKSEILSIPSEAKKVKEELLEKLKISSIDNAGILKELEVVKNKSFKQDRLNEYFHIQLDRLKSKDKE